MKYSLKRRVSLILFLIILISSITLTIHIRKNINATKFNIMTNYKVSKRNNLDNIFINLKEDLKLQLYDYASWDEVYYSMLEKNTPWLKENATEFMYKDKSYNLDFIYVETNDESYYEYYGDKNRLNSFKNSYLWKERKFNITYNNTYKNNYNVDFIFLENDLYLMAMAPITTNDKSKSCGYYVMGRKIKEDYLNELLKPYFLSELKRFSFCKEYLNDDELTKEYDLNLYYPLKNSKDETMNILKLKFNIKNYISNLDDLSPNIFKMILIIMGISALIIIHYVYYICKILDKIILQLAYIAEGNYTHKININKSIELKKLINSIHHLGNTLDKKIKELKRAFLDITYVLIKTVETKDSYTRGHSERVSKYAEIIGKHMQYPKISELKTAALVHDIGKVDIDKYILNKAGKLTDAEFEEIKKHPQKGFEILDKIKSMENIKIIVKQHHERYDGKGYPDNLKENEIHLAARIISVTDAFDAMTSHRAYRKAMEFEKAVNIIKENSGTQFDPDVVQAFLDCKDTMF